MISKLKEKLTKSKFLRSFKVRIFVIIVLMGIIPSIIMRYGVLTNYVSRAVSVRTSDVQNQIKILANHLVGYNYFQDTSSEVINAELEQLSNLYDGRVLIINENFKIVKDTYGISEGKYMISQEVIKCFQGENISKYDQDNYYIEMTTPIADNTAKIQKTDTETNEQEEKPKVKGVMLISVSTDSIINSADFLSRKSLILEITMFTVVFAIAIALSKGLLKPFKRVTEAISEVKEGYTDQISNVPDYLETEYIIDAFKNVLARIKVLDDSRQEFVSNVSHELKTPITSMKVLADSLLMQEDAPLELYKEFMVDITEEIDRESKIINDLLSLVKLDKKAANINIETININQLMELILKRLRPIAIKQNVELIFESMRSITAEADEVKLTLALSNLIENAIKYNKAEGWVKVILDADHQFFTIEISDSGIGIPEEEFENIYERFYRVDKSHSREIGGTGLGLAITRNAILMHRGSVRVSSVEGEGTTFTVKIPLSYIA